MAERARVVAIVQARMSSSRLPGKVLRRAGGLTLLEHLVRRLRRCARLDAIVVATTVNPSDDAVVEACEALGIGCVRGSEDDVLGRFVAAHEAYGGEVLVRLTADCPLLDPTEVDRLLGEFEAAATGVRPLEYLTNQRGLERVIPRGFDVEVFTAAALRRADDETTEAGDREHVTPYLYRVPGRFRNAVSEWARPDASHLRLTVDTPEDLAVVTAIVDALGVDAEVESITRFMAAHPAVAALNAGIVQKSILSEDALRRQRIAGRCLVGRADAGRSIGFGHLARVEAILDTWTELGGRAVLRGAGVQGAIADRLRAAGVTIEPVPDDLLIPGPTPETTQLDPSDLAETAGLCADVDAAALVVDGYHLRAPELAALHAVAPLLSIDDLAAWPIAADVVLNQNMDFDAARYDGLGQARRLIGASYALLRRELREAAKLRADGLHGGGTVLLTFGGADPANLTAPVAHAMLDALDEGCEVVALVGRGLSEVQRRDLEAHADRAPARLIILENVAALAPVFATADVAVSAAGATTWELMASGVAVLVIAVADNQLAVSLGAARQGAAIDLGWHTDLEPAHVAAEVRRLLTDPAARARLASRGRALIDGRGTRRAIDALLDAIDQRGIRP